MNKNPKLDVFLRTCSRTGILPGQRCVGDSREQMILKCVQSLVSSIKNYSSSPEDVKLWIVDDHSSIDFIEKLKEITNIINTLIIPLSGTGARDSAVAQFELCRDNGSELVYLVEDDYFHSPTAIQCMFDSWKELRTISQFYPVALFPYDSIDRYRRDQPQPSRIFYLDGVHWRTVNKSTNTIFLPHSVFANTYHIWEYLAKNYSPGGITEDSTINSLWNTMCDFGGPILLFSPIPSLAIHLEHQEPTTTFHGFGAGDWKKYWNALDISKG